VATFAGAAKVEPGGFTDSTRRLSNAKQYKTSGHHAQSTSHPEEVPDPRCRGHCGYISSEPGDFVWSPAIRFPLAPRLGAIHFREDTGGLHCVPTSGYFLATLRVVARHSKTLRFLCFRLFVSEYLQCSGSLWRYAGTVHD